MGDLSPHFSRWEFDCPDGNKAAPDPLLLHCLERLRAIVCAAHGSDMPLHIVSGYRDAAYNAHVGGAPHSQHCQNRAADIPSGYATTPQAEAAGFTGVGACGGWAVHVDVRHGAAVVFRDC